MKWRLSIVLVALMIAAVGCNDDGQSTPPMGGSGGSGGIGGIGGGSGGSGGIGGSGGSGGIGGSGGSGGIGGSGGTGGTPISFAADIQPYFEPDPGADCVLCHSNGNGPKGVDLDSYANIMAGGDNGPLVVPFDSTDSTAILIPKLEANHNNGPDDAGFVVTLSQWIDEGALDN